MQQSKLHVCNDIVNNHKVTDQSEMKFAPIIYLSSIYTDTWIDYEYIRQNNVFTNHQNARAQTAATGTVPVSIEGSVTTTLKNDGVTTIGVYKCESANNGNNKYSAALLPQLAYDEFSLEVIAKINALNTVFPGYIVGLEDTQDTAQGNAISFNQITGKPSGVSNRFFPANKVTTGWQATDTYWNSVAAVQDIVTDTFYHIIISQDSVGVVRVYVNGM